MTIVSGLFWTAIAFAPQQPSVIQSPDEAVSAETGSVTQDLTEDEIASVRQAASDLRGGRSLEALEILEPLSRRHPNESEIQRLLAHAYTELGRWDEARDAALRAWSGTGGAAEILALLARVDQHRDDRVALEAGLRVLALVEPDEPAWRRMLARTLEDHGALAEAASVLESMLLSQPAAPDLHAALGNIRARQERVEDAIASWECAWYLGSTAHGLAESLARVWLRLGDPEQATRWIDRIPRSEISSTATLRVDAARLFFEQQRWAEAQRTLEPVVQGPAASGNTGAIRAEAYFVQGLVHQARGHRADVERSWRLAYEAGCRRATLLRQLGEWAHLTGDHESAVRLLRDSLQSGEPLAEQPQRFLIISLLRQDRRDEARRALLQYVEHFGVDGPGRELIRAWNSLRHASLKTP